MGSLLLFLLASAAPAQAFAQAIEKDARFQSIEFGSGGLFHIRTSPDTSQTVLFAPGERIQSVTLSDPGAYLVTISGLGDSLTMRANGPSSFAVMSVRTAARSYELELVPGAGSGPQIIRFTYAARPSAPHGQLPSSPAAAAASWRLSGTKSLRPESVSDDGEKTYIAWFDKQAMPAVFAVGPGGKEEMVDGYVRDGILTIDRVYRRLVFRIDRQSATARRKVTERPKHD